jgi:hypothetical protein
MKRFTAEEKAMWLEDWQHSGKGAWAYARANGLCPQTFVNWTKPKVQNCLVEVPAKTVTPLQIVQEILIEKGEVKIHIPLALGYRELAALFGALGQTV